MSHQHSAFWFAVVIFATFAPIGFASDHQGKSFTGRVTASTISRRFEADTIIAQVDPRFVLNIEITASTDSTVKVREVKKVAIHSPVITFGAAGPIGREVRCTITKPAEEGRLASGHLTVTPK